MTTIEPPAPRANPDLHGQDPALDRLRRSLGSGRLPHGWLLTGPSGIGKATLAFRLARALLAEPGAVDHDLGLAASHPVFRQVAQGAHPDLSVLEAERDPKTGRIESAIPVDRVRRATARLRTTAAMGGHRVLVIDGAELLNRSAANALLKCLEEPPPATVIVLTSDRPARLAATIRSRCARLALTRLPEPNVRTLLARWLPDLDEPQRAALALLARGSIGRALALAEGDSLGRYRRLVEALATDRIDPATLDALAGELARSTDTLGVAGPLGLIQAFMGRIVDVGLDRLGPALFVDEPKALSRLAASRPLEAWASLWDNLAPLAAAIEPLHLDRGRVLGQILHLLAFGPAGDAGRGGREANLGAADVFA